ncbi:MAG TPA: competence protein ComEC [Cyanobacteria bacterium UBA8156]|nr:competence protein ComEC [Cyanobacteria bacterium UBA8156]
MSSAIAFLWSVAFLMGAYASGLPLGWWAVAAAFGIWFGLAIAVPLVLPRFLPRWAFLVAAVVAAIARAYGIVRIPQPAANDISRIEPGPVVVQGTLVNTPTMNRSGRGRFLLQAETIRPEKSDEPAQAVSGRVYTTVSLLKTTGLRPGQKLEVSGLLYRPRPAQNPGAFDFRAFLARQGVFAGMGARDVKPLSPPPGWGTWWVRDRIVRAHTTGLGVPAGPLLSSMLLGSLAIDLEADIKDQFVRVGLAAVLAASGFQVTLALGIALKFCENARPAQKLAIGLLTLGGLFVLTGGSPSVARATVMGMGGLLGLVSGRKTQPLFWLVLAAILLTVLQPMWIWDLGFQFSFLATLGLMVSAQPIAKYLQGLPPAIAEPLAISLAASLWTLPLQLFAFGRISPYGAIANVLVLPLVSLATLGGAIAGALGVVLVPLGALASWVLLAPMTLLLAIVDGFDRLPGVAATTGRIELWQLVAAYGAIVLAWSLSAVGKRWPAIGLFLLVILFLPGLYARQNTFQMVFLENRNTPSAVIQNQGQTVAINAGNASNVGFTLLPLLQSQGINRIDWAIATDPQPEISEGWRWFADPKALRIGKFVDLEATGASQTYRETLQQLRDRGTAVTALAVGQSLELGPQIRIERVHRLALRLQVGDRTWLHLITSEDKAQDELAASQANLQADILWWNGRPLREQLWARIQPQIALASSNTLPESTQAQLEKRQIPAFWTGRDGALQWQPDGSIQPLREATDRQGALL